ncbi:extended synaptotagmin-3-like isoform X3 [Diorhabda sublineata]|uniref:extended synaptotagmin-3-like isoform X3 n=1 Tax=Diorhabda sublineata TaxID=1163346 RepID=UPI0024E0EF3B|nr:extended synaptotagmin-3-like isoform X3 [Diorhabda sublineata]XP_056636298.1 extended synaptotagmin-3-like isoform X3 [Diorhabda sublineata]
MAVTNDNTIEKSSFRIVKRIILYIFIYLIGYFNCSITWILILVFATTLSEDYLNFKNRKRTFAKKTANGNEKDVILENLGELPSWVVFPDVERAEWLNKIVKQCWPFVNYYARDLVKNYLEIKLKKNLEKYGLKGFHFERIVLGSVPCRTGGIIVYDNVSREEIVMDIDITYAGDCDVKFRLRGLLGGIKNLQMYGTLRVVLKPLIRHLPLIGGVQLFFLNNPDIDFDLDGIAGILDIPGINECLRKCICATVGSLFVLPNKFPLKFCREVSSEQLNTPNPAGVLRVHVIEAKDLLKKDLSFTGKSKSDPYAVLVVGEQSFKTETIPSNVNPKWDYWCEFVILEFTGQELLISVWDEDPTEDEFLGRASIDIASLIKEGLSDMWLVLEDVKHGDIHIRTTWLTLTTEYSNLKAALYESQQLQLSHMSSSLLIVYIDSATNLKIFHNNNFQEYLEKRPSSRNSMSSIDTIEKDFTDSESISSDSTKYSSHSRRHTKNSLKSNNSFCSRTSQESYGDINLTMRYSLQRQRLIVVVHRVCNLYFEDPTEDKDIYVKIYLLPERCKANKRKTKVIKNCREPAFDKRFEFLVAQDDLNDKYLEVSVIEEKMIKNEILGQVSIDLKNISLPITRSFELGPSIKHN